MLYNFLDRKSGTRAWFTGYIHFGVTPHRSFRQVGTYMFVWHYKFRIHLLVPFGRYVDNWWLYASFDRVCDFFIVSDLPPHSMYLPHHYRFFTKTHLTPLRHIYRILCKNQTCSVTSDMNYTRMLYISHTPRGITQWRLK